MASLASRILPAAIKQRLKPMLRDRSVSMSQAGQDLWVYGEVFNEMRGGFFVDIGAHDGVDLSNTYLLERSYGWTGICIEANPDTYAELAANRSATCLNCCVDAEEGTVSFAKAGVMGGIVDANTRNPSASPHETIELVTRPLDRVLQDAGAPRVIDYLSIDIEGAEERVLGRFDFNAWQFRSITIEQPSARLRSVFQEHGYLLMRDIPGLDAFYVHTSHKDEYLMNIYRFYNKKFFRSRWS